MLADISIGVGVLAVIGTLSKWTHSRMNRMEANRKQDLYQANGQTNYGPRGECKAVQETFCNKIDEVKTLLVAMDDKREDTKDTYHKEQQNIGERLAGIEAKLQ